MQEEEVENRRKEGNLGTNTSLLYKAHTFSVDAAPFDPTKGTVKPGPVAAPFDPKRGGPRHDMRFDRIPDPDLQSMGPQWGFPAPFMMMPPVPPMPAFHGNVEMFPGPPQVHYVPPVKKEGGEKEGLSVHAKPWCPLPEKPVEPVKEENVEDIMSGMWTSSLVNGKVVMAPTPMIAKERSSNLFVHSFPVIPRNNRQAEMEFFNYNCARCPLKTLFGKLSSRKADVTLRNIASDVPPLCVAHMVEQITKAKVVATLAGSLWTCPMSHGYAVFAEHDAARIFLRNHLDGLKAMPESASSPYPLVWVEVKEH